MVRATASKTVDSVTLRLTPAEARFLLLLCECCTSECETGDGRAETGCGIADDVAAALKDYVGVNDVYTYMTPETEVLRFKRGTRAYFDDDAEDPE